MNLISLGSLIISFICVSGWQLKCLYLVVMFFLIFVEYYFIMIYCNNMNLVTIITCNRAADITQRAEGVRGVKQVTMVTLRLVALTTANLVPVL